MPGRRSKPGDFWVVEVRELPDLVSGSPGYTQRFRFEGTNAKLLAWDCYQAAKANGFEATAEQVRNFKGAPVNG